MCSYRQKTSIIYSFSKIVHFGTGQNRLLSSKATIIVKSVYFYRLSFPFSLTQINDFDDNVQLSMKRFNNLQLLRFEHYRQYCRLSSKATIIVKSVYFYRLSFPQYPPLGIKKPRIRGVMNFFLLLHLKVEANIRPVNGVDEFIASCLVVCWRLCLMSALLPSLVNNIGNVVSE